MTSVDPHVAGGQIVGERERQEDWLGIKKMDGVSGALALALADGMGGHAGGNVAAKTAVDSFLAHIGAAAEPVTAALKPALMAANASISEAVKKDPKLEGMGSTLVGVLIDGDRLSWISVGDSSLLLVRNGEAVRLNADHSMRPVLADLVTTGRITDADAARDPNRNALRSAVSGEEISLIDQSRSEHLLRPGDVLLLCSDGVDTLELKDISRLTTEAAPNGAQAIVDALLEAVGHRKRKRQDNATAIAYVYSGTLMSLGAARPDATAARNMRAIIGAALVVAIAIAAVVAWLELMPRKIAPPVRTAPVAKTVQQTVPQKPSSAAATAPALVAPQPSAKSPAQFPAGKPAKGNAPGAR